MVNTTSEKCSLGFEELVTDLLGYELNQQNRSSWSITDKNNRVGTVSKYSTGDVAKDGYRVVIDNDDNVNFFASREFDSKHNQMVWRCYSNGSNQKNELIIGDNFVSMESSLDDKIETHEVSIDEKLRFTKNSYLGEIFVAKEVSFSNGEAYSYSLIAEKGETKEEYSLSGKRLDNDTIILDMRTPEVETKSAISSTIEDLAKEHGSAIADFNEFGELLTKNFPFVTDLLSYLYGDEIVNRRGLQAFFPRNEVMKRKALARRAA